MMSNQGKTKLIYSQGITICVQTHRHRVNSNYPMIDQVPKENP